MNDAKTALIGIQLALQSTVKKHNFESTKNEDYAIAKMPFLNQRYSLV
jgi:hypothetical protein